MRRLATLLLLITAANSHGHADTYPYVTRTGRPLLIDVHHPTKTSGELSPVILWFHGGGWKQGSRNDRKLIEWILGEGFAIASADYRLSPMAPFPAQMDDCKAALNWIRENAESHRLDPDRIILAGLSAGAHLASLTGFSDDDSEHPVRAVLHFFGPADFVQMSRYARDPEDPLNQPDSNVFQLFDGPLLENASLAREASPVSYLDESDPPSLILVGDSDTLMTQRQCRRLQEAALSKGLRSELHLVAGAGHGGPQFSDATRRSLILTFLQSL